MESLPPQCSEVGLACRNGNLEELKNLISQGRPVDAADSRGWHPLHETSVSYRPSAEKLKCLEELLKYENINVDCRTHLGETPLYLACKLGDEKYAQQAVKMLMYAGADVNTYNNQFVTPLLVATRSGRMDIVHTLLNNQKTDPNLRDHNGWRPLHEVVRNGRMDLVQILLKSGARQNVRNKNGTTPLYLAVACRNLDCLRLLIEVARERCQIPMVNEPHGVEIFMHAIQKGLIEYIQLLVPYCSNIHFQNVLHIAIQKNNHQLLKLLLQVTDVEELKNKCVIPYDHPELPEMFNPLHLAVLFQSHECLTVLLEAGFPVDSIYITNHLDLEDEIGTCLPEFETPLSCSLRRNDIETAKILLGAGANSNPCGIHVFPPMFSAIWNGSSEEIDLLLDHGADFGRRELLLVAFVVPVNLCHILRRGADPMSYFNSYSSFFGDALFNHKRQEKILSVSQMLLVFLDHEASVSNFFTTLAARCREYFRTEYSAECWSSLLNSVHSPSSLASVCRIFVRRHLLGLHGKSLGDPIDSLELLPSLISYLNYEDILAV